MGINRFMDITIDLKNYNKKSTIFNRIASRAIIKNKDKYLLIFSKYGDYKFPGGGVNKGEELKAAMVREVKEETGYYVKIDSIKKYGKVHEIRKGEYQDILEMTSHYYFCDVSSKVGNRNLDEYEKEYDYQIVWITLEEAIEKNKKLTDLDKFPWVIRETKVMEYILNEQYLNTFVLPYIPEDMRELIKGHYFERDSIGCSGSDIYLFENDLVLKVENKRDESDGEYEMIKWLEDKLPVPIAVKYYTNGKINYLLMTKLKGKMVCHKDIIKDSENMARLLARGLKQLWHVNIEDCPRKIDINYKLTRAYYNVVNNLVDIENTEPEIFSENGFKNPMDLYDYLHKNRPSEDFVLIHGDYCLPNVFINNNEISGYLDLGYCGIGDKWQDIALAVRSMKSNMCDIGKESEYEKLYKIFFDELGIEPDESKIKYYILLDELF